MQTNPYSEWLTDPILTSETISLHVLHTSEEDEYIQIRLPEGLCFKESWGYWPADGGCEDYELSEFTKVPLDELGPLPAEFQETANLVKRAHAVRQEILETGRRKIPAKFPNKKVVVLLYASDIKSQFLLSDGSWVEVHLLDKKRMLELTEFCDHLREFRGDTALLDLLEYRWEAIGVDAYYLYLRFAGYLNKVEILQNHNLDRLILQSKHTDYDQEYRPVPAPNKYRIEEREKTVRHTLYVLGYVHKSIKPENMYLMPRCGYAKENWVLGDFEYIYPEPSRHYDAYSAGDVLGDYLKKAKELG